jgi:hypothetical protein
MRKILSFVSDLVLHGCQKVCCVFERNTGLSCHRITAALFLFVSLLLGCCLLMFLWRNLGVLRADPQDWSAALIGVLPVLVVGPFAAAWATGYVIPRFRRAASMARIAECGMRSNVPSLEGERVGMVGGWALLTTGILAVHLLGFSGLLFHVVAFLWVDVFVLAIHFDCCVSAPPPKLRLAYATSVARRSQPRRG